MTKYEQLVKLIEIGLTKRGDNLQVVFTALSHVWNNWSKLQSVIDICQDPVEKMASDYINSLLAGYVKPEWLVHLSDLA